MIKTRQCTSAAMPVIRIFIISIIACYRSPPGSFGKENGIYVIIFLDTILEVGEKLDNPTIAHYSECIGEPPPTLLGILPINKSGACSSYQWHHGDFSDEEFEKHTENEYTAEPFIKFG